MGKFLRNPPSSRIHLLKRMMDELTVIHDLIRCVVLVDSLGVKEQGNGWGGGVSMSLSHDIKGGWYLGLPLREISPI